MGVADRDVEACRDVLCGVDTNGGAPHAQRRQLSGQQTGASSPVRATPALLREGVTRNGTRESARTLLA